MSLFALHYTDIIFGRGSHFEHPQSKILYRSPTALAILLYEVAASKTQMSLLWLKKGTVFSTSRMTKDNHQKGRTDFI